MMCGFGNLNFSILLSYGKKTKQQNIKPNPLTPTNKQIPKLKQTNKTERRKKESALSEISGKLEIPFSMKRLTSPVVHL